MRGVDAPLNLLLLKNSCQNYQPTTIKIMHLQTICKGVAISRKLLQKIKHHPCLPGRQALLTMKFTTLMLIACFQAGAVSVAQNITLSKQNVSLKEVLRDIKQQT